MVIIKDFEMPQSCCECCFRYYDETDGNWYCPVTKDFADIVNKGRHDDCPLVEVEDGNDDRGIVAKVERTKKTKHYTW